MTGSQQYTPAQILAIGHRAEREGNLEYATQFYSYLADNLAGTPEAVDARLALERLSPQSQRYTEPAPTQFSQSPPATGPEPSVYDEPHRMASHSQPYFDPAGHPAATVPAAQVTRHSASWAAPSPPTPDGQTALPQNEHVRHHGAAVGYHHEYAPTASAERGDQQAPLPRVVRGDEEGEEETEFVPGYRFGRFIAFALRLLGWLMFIGGIAFVTLTVAGVVGSQVVPALGGIPVGVTAGSAAIAAGLALAFIGSLAQATFEAANNTREIVEIERAKAGW